MDNMAGPQRSVTAVKNRGDQNERVTEGLKVLGMYLIGSPGVMRKQETLF
jgi:hypothetical protein